MNVCTCPSQQKLDDYLMGTLESADDKAIDEHLEGCSACQAAIDVLDARANAAFACLRDTPVEAAGTDNPALRQLVHRAVALESKTSPATRWPMHAGGDMPHTLGNYVLLEPLGAGGMGQVFKAEHQRMKRVVALKVLAPQLVRSAAARARFRREVEAVSRLSSPHIVAAFDAGESDGRDYLVMEYVPGQTLADRVRDSGPLPIEYAMDVTRQAAVGLQHAHQAGIIHRDVKPSNILVAAAAGGQANTDPRPHVKLLDLGLARLRTDGEKLDLTGTDAPMGTTHFMAPEQAANPRAVDERADIYGLGCTLFFMLTGQPPYDGDGAMAVLVAHREQPVPSLQAARPDCPPALDALFHRLVAKRPADRPASMREVIAELELVRRLPNRPLLPPERRQRPRGRPALALFAASLLFAAFLGLLLGGGGPEGDDDATPGGAPESKQSASGAAPLAKKGPTIDMVPIPAGEFFMGASDSDKNAATNEKPRRPVTIKLPFLMGKTEVTQAQYEEVMGKNPSAFAATGKYAQFVKGKDTSQLPVESVSWLDAIRFCIRLSERHGLAPFYTVDKLDEQLVKAVGGTGYRLPTEAEWEYACRGGSETMWSFGEKASELGDHAWFAANAGDVTHPVGTKKANPFGLYDMYGNVPEWCWDRYDERYYDYIPASDPVSRTTSAFRSFRGGAWNMDANNLRTTWRRPLGIAYGSGPDAFHHIGIRVVRDRPQE